MVWGVVIGEGGGRRGQWLLCTTQLATNQLAITLLQSEHSWLAATFPSVLTPPPCAGFLLSAEDFLNGLCLVDMALEDSGVEPGQRKSDNDVSHVELSSTCTWISV